MQFEGKEQFSASPESVWEFVTDPERVSRCIPGLESVAPSTDPTVHELVVRSKVGPVQQIFDLKLAYTLVKAPNEARLSIRGKGRDGSYVGGSSYMHLKELDEAGTEMEWSFVIALTGQLASLASRYVDPVFRKLSHEFLTAVSSELQGAT
ncbi:MAG: SRPBCC family protein [Thermoanaerobaculia bacterium]|nr:SRPBCC family protein [Thermoanaerobaculia bacterium]